MRRDAALVPKISLSVIMIPKIRLGTIPKKSFLSSVIMIPKIFWSFSIIILIITIGHSSSAGIPPEMDDGDASTAICSSMQCTCNYPSKITSCSGLVFEYLPSFPTWTETLVLNDNHVTLLRDNAFEGLTRLKRLYLSSSKLEYIESGAFRGVDELTVLDLSYNRLYYWPMETFQPLSRLTILNLSSNAFDDITIFTKLLPIGQNELIELTIGGNRYTRKSADFVTLPPTRRLVLSGSKFQSIIGRSVTLMNAEHDGNLTVRMDALAQADHLDLFDCDALLDCSFFDAVRDVIDLNVGGNRISNATIIFDKFKNFPRLQRLNVSGLRMDSDAVTSWRTFPGSLNSLDVSSLGIKNISFKFLPSTTRITTLFASNNLMENLRLPRSLRALRTLRLGGNRLTRFPVVDSGVAFDAMESLDLSGNFITAVEPSSLNVFPNLRELHLSHNRIVHIHPASFSICCSESLFVLDISHNSIENMPNVTLSSLRILNLSSNRLIRIENGTLSRSKNLEILDISTNTDLMTDLNLFTCTDDGDNEENYRMTGKGNLCPLSFSWLDELTSLANLKRLNSRAVALSTIPSIQYAKLLSHLEHLDLSENFITTDQWESIASTLPKKGCLRSINLRRNRLTGLKNLSVFDNECLERVDLSENPFDCNCHLESVYSLLRSLPNSERDIYNGSIYYCFSTASYYRYPLYEYITTLQPCSYYESSQSTANTNGLRIILATFLTLVALVLIAVFCRTSLVTAFRYGYNLRQNMYKPLRVIISGGSNGDLSSPVML